MAYINRLACTVNYSSLYLSSVSVCPSPTAPNPLIIISSQSTSLWLLSCISNCRCFWSLPLWLPGFRVAVSLTPSLFNAMPRNLGFLKQWRVSISHVFSPPSYNFKDFQILESMCFGEGLAVSQGTIWGKKKKTQCVITAFKWTPVLVQSTLTYICLLKAECSTRTKLLPFFPLWLLKKDIYTDSIFLFNLEKYASLSFSCRPQNSLPFNVRSASR